MKVWYLLVAAFTVIALIISTVEFKTAISKECGLNELREKNTYFLNDWLSADKPEGFIDCIGSVTVLKYRPLDLSSISLLIAASALIYAISKDHN